MLFGLFGTGVSTAVAVRWDPFGIRVVVVGHWCALDQADGDTGLVSLDHASNFSRKPDIDTARLEILFPSSVEFAELGEHDHRREVTCDTLVVGRIPHTIRGTCTQSFQDDTRYIGRFVPGSEEQSNHGHGDGVGEFFGKEEHLEENLDRDQSEEYFEPADDLEHAIEPPDLFLVSSE
jgi:hypothetical protein